ncbi:MAG: hypothetical protein V1770_05165 [bacterium]
MKYSKQIKALHLSKAEKLQRLIKLGRLVEDYNGLGSLDSHLGWDIGGIWYNCYMRKTYRIGEITFFSILFLLL